MTLGSPRPPLERALLEQVGPDQAATLILTWRGGDEERFSLRPAEAKLLRLLWRERAAQAETGFSEPGWVRLSALPAVYLRLFDTLVTPHALTQHLFRLRKVLGEAAIRVVASDRSRGTRLLVDLECRLGI